MTRPGPTRALAAGVLVALVGACGASPPERAAAPDGETLVLGAPATAWPDVITDGPERVALLRSELGNLVTLAPLSDGELDEIDAIEDGLAAFEAGRAVATLDELEQRHAALEAAVFARMR